MPRSIDPSARDAAASANLRAAEDRAAPPGIPWLPIAATLGIATLVGSSSRGAPVWTELRDGQADRVQVLDRVAEEGLLGRIIATAIVISIHYLVMARRPGAPPLRQTLLRVGPRDGFDGPWPLDWRYDCRGRLVGSAPRHGLGHLRLSAFLTLARYPAPSSGGSIPVG